ncbi:C40 family peptidase [Streptomyces sp. NBC_00704]|uniref:C40 family peptidase n=1 Tax=Streptomyces sp. NBC_00704 TaxID=2975809 RepID=UPI002E30EEB0|nr:C40 family peptidase [Streptomyces sp. NBC_00704]
MATDRSPRSPGSSDEPSRAEIQQRVSSLYDRAESDTGTYNATRAMSGRSRKASPPAPGNGRRSGDPSLDAVARQWFDRARDRVGPTVPAVLPTDRLPTPAPRRAPAAERPGDSAVVRELEAGVRRTPELTGRAVAALPAVPEPRQGEPKAPAPAALPALTAGPAAPAPAAAAPADRQASLKSTKERNGRKLATARDILARAVGRPAPALPAAAPAPLPAAAPTAVLPVPDAQAVAAQPVQQPWDTAEQQAFRAEITAAWAGRPAAGPPDPTGADALLTATGPLAAVTTTSGFPARTADFGTQAPAFAAPAPGFGAQAPAAAPASNFAPSEAALVAPAASGPDPLMPQPASFAAQTGAALPEPGPRAWESGILTPDGGTGGLAVANGHPVPEPAFAAAPSGYPVPDFGLPMANTGLQASVADALTGGFGQPAAGPVVAGPPPGQAAAELLPTGPEYGFAPAADALTMDRPGVTVPAWDVITVGSGYPAVATPATPAAPAVPLAATVAPVAGPADATSRTTGTAYLGKADKALAFARAQVGRPCVWGATGPESYDCSSLTQAAWRAAGVTLPRSAIDQAKAFTRVSLADLRPGDLVFFFDDLRHTGLCTGDGMMIHAPGPGASIREEAILPFGEGALRGAVRPA